MNPAVYDTVTCDIATDQGLVLRSTGSIIKFMGFLAAYEEKEDKVEEEVKTYLAHPVERLSMIVMSWIAVLVLVALIILKVAVI
jgi:DNA topoisomerase IA